MATQSWSTRVRQDTDAMFREWGSELNTKLAAAGLVQTADTGQINWTTVTRAAANTDAGYEIWKLNDSLFGTAPVYFRIGYGSASTSSGARIRITVGTATDGAGTLSGVTSTATVCSYASFGTLNSDTARASYLCVAEGFFGLIWKVGVGNGATASGASFFFCRTADSSGTPTVTGATAWWGAGGNASGPNKSQSFRYAATAGAFTAQTSTFGNMMLTFFAQSQTNTNVGSDIQAALCYGWTPRMEPLFGLAGVLDGELSVGSTMSVAMIGTTPRTYLAGGASETIGAGTLASGFPKAAMLWE